MEEIARNNTVGQARDFLTKNAMKGTKCPCCHQTVKFYKRKLNSGMARVLIELHKAPGPLNVKDHLREHKMRNNHDWTLLRYWGLTEEHVDPESAMKNTGVWSITKQGEMFVQGLISVNKYILLYNNQKIGTEGEIINIEEALGDAFDYKELMNQLKTES